MPELGEFGLKLSPHLNSLDRALLLLRDVQFPVHLSHVAFQHYVDAIRISQLARVAALCHVIAQ